MHPLLSTDDCALDAWAFWSEAVEHADAFKWLRGINTAIIGLNSIAMQGFRRQDMEAWLWANLTAEGWEMFELRRTKNC